MYSIGSGAARQVPYSGPVRIYKGFPIEHKPNSFCLTPLHMPDRRKKVKDCGTTNGHLELIARTLMKDAREGLVR
ncbi:hypothetical protein PSA3335_17215 [Pseudomonas savastanoi pv. savastanoi NCPPB 3335]|uniref:Uncharacterized protein n=1 Tax=Pseudomonas savastanoi pv. savastanoi NCPPB 3335 TaxID=693985 RepID=A0ABC8BFP5_PSESS|nr:hypothetical protein PSA3335_17215 [Pseudomonas savastanoi pv. savastanoi NCPPB 3335]